MHCSQSKSKNVKFWPFPELPLTKNWKNINSHRERMFTKTCKSARIGFWVCQLQCTMLQLCVTSTFWVIKGFSAFVMGRSRYRVLKHCVEVKCDPRKTAAYVPFHFMDLNPISCYVSPEIVIFHEPLIVGTCNKCHWIWHTSNPKYAPLKQFQCIFPVKINKMLKYSLILWFFEEPLITETQNLWYLIWHASNLKYAPLKEFQSIFPSQNEQNVIFWLFPELYLTTNWKKTSICTGKKCLQRLANLHI